jgi:hypothetical protein
VKSSSRLLVEIHEDDLDQVFVTYTDHDDDAVFVYSTCWRGLVSGHSYMVFHETEKPGAECFRSLERRELAALEQATVGAMQ